MLTGLQIRNFAVIADADLVFGPQLTGLTGETGAGKSLVVDALLLALGERADASAVRSGAARAEVSAVFALDDAPQARAWLVEHELDADGECVLRRTVNADGRSRCYVNAQPVPAPQVRAIGQLLVEIHGQNAYQALLRADAQRRLVDRHGACEALATEVSRLWAAWRDAARALEASVAQASAREAHLELLAHQVAELTALGLTPGEWESLEQEQRRLGHVQTLAEGVASALDHIAEAEDANAADLLARAAHSIGRLVALDPLLNAPAQELDGALAQCRDAATALRHYVATLEADPQRAELVDTRLQAALTLSRKHRCEPTALAELTASLGAQLAELQNPQAQLAGLTQTLAGALDDYTAAANRLHKARARAAQSLSEAVTAQLAGLGMSHARLEVALTPGDGSPGPDGGDSVELRLRPHADSVTLPLAKIASGGELSRVSLAIEVAALARQDAPTVVLDEVDVGIGGATATVVGGMLRTLANQRQLICITHLPQVAAHAHHHLRVHKRSDASGAQTTVEALGPQERVNELARMLGGGAATARAHATELLRAGASP